MEALKRFDEEFKRINYNEISSKNIVKYIFIFVGMLMVIFPPTEVIFVIGTWEFLSVPVIVHLKNVLYTTQGKQRTPVYSVLRITPADRKTYIYIRLKYLLSFLGKLCIPCIILQMLGLLMSGFTVTGLIYSLIYLLAIFISYAIIGYGDIIISTK